MHFYPLIGQCVVLLTEVSAEFPNPRVEVISELLLTFIQNLLVPKDITPPRVDSEVVNETYLFCFFVFFLPGAEWDRILGFSDKQLPPLSRLILPELVMWLMILSVSSWLSTPPSSSVSLSVCSWLLHNKFCSSLPDADLLLPNDRAFFTDLRDMFLWTVC